MMIKKTQAVESVNADDVDGSFVVPMSERLPLQVKNKIKGQVMQSAETQ